MAVSGQQVFDLAMGLIDEVSETGSLALDNPGYYKTKATTFLTMLQTELLPHTQSSTVINDLAQNLSVSDRMALLALPYGLAAHILLQEDPNTASFYNDRYEELKRKQPATPQKIRNVYRGEN